MDHLSIVASSWLNSNSMGSLYRIDPTQVSQVFRRGTSMLGIVEVLEYLDLEFDKGAFAQMMVKGQEELAVMPKPGTSAKAPLAID